MEISVDKISFSLALTEITVSEFIRDISKVVVLGYMEDLEKYDRKEWFGKADFSVLKTTGADIEGYEVMERMNLAYNDTVRILFYNKSLHDWVYLEYYDEFKKPFFAVKNVKPIKDMTERMIKNYRNAHGKLVIANGGSLRYLQNSTLSLLPLIYYYKRYLEADYKSITLTKGFVGIVDGYFLGNGLSPERQESILGQDYQTVATVLGKLPPILPIVDDLKCTRLKKFMFDKITPAKEEDKKEEIDKAYKQLFTMDELLHLPKNDNEYYGIFRGKEITELYDDEGRNLEHLVDAFMYFHGKIHIKLKATISGGKFEEDIIKKVIEKAARDTFDHEVIVKCAGEKDEDVNL